MGERLSLKDKLIESSKDIYQKLLIKEKVKQLKQMIILEGEESSNGTEFNLKLDNDGVLRYSNEGKTKKFTLNYKMGEVFTGPVLELIINKSKVSLSSLSQVFEIQTGSFFKSESGYFHNGLGYVRGGIAVSGNEARFLAEKGVPILKSTDPNPFPEQIRINQATLNVLKLMNCEEPNFGVYVQAVQAAEI